MDPPSPQPRLTLAFAADHAGAQLKQLLAERGRALGHEVIDLGPAPGSAPIDYPAQGKAVADAVAAGTAGLGVLVCGSGIGVSIAANRRAGIRCALVHDSLSARLARRHNDANIMALGARLIGPETALDAFEAFLSTPFDGGRHARRVEQLG